MNQTHDTDYTLGGTVAQHLDMTTSDPLARFLPLKHWLDARAEAGLYPYVKATETEIAPRLRALGSRGEEWEGVNFASQDYLNLATHPGVRQAAKAAVDAVGVHSAGSSALMGYTVATLSLEARVAAFTGYQTCTVFPTGWAAGYGILRTLVRPQDHVVIDVLAHACLHEGARAATPHVHVFAHLSNTAVARKLAAIRQADPSTGIVVVSESTFSMDSDVPDLAGLQEICTRHGARLVVDCAHDLGAIGPTGRGYLEVQGMVGKVDVLMGSFSKTFASNGGFVCSNAPGLDLGIRYTCGPQTFSNAMSPVNATIVHTCIDIVDSPEGADLRARLMANVRRLRAGLIGAGFNVPGQDSAIVPVILGDNALSRRMTRHALKHGAIVNLVEYPAVSRNTCRWRLQVMARHAADDIDRMTGVAIEARLLES